MNAKLNYKQILTAGAIAAAVSVIMNAILYFIFRGAGVFTDTLFIQPNQPLTLVPIIISSILPSLIGASVFFLFEKYMNNGFKVFSIVALVLMVLSFANPFMGIPGISVAAGIALNIMHVVVALSLLFFIKRAKK